MTVFDTRHVVGLPVLGTSEGEKLGKIKDVLVDAPADRVVGFLVEPTGEERDLQVLLAEDVRAIGEDAITVEGRARLRRLAGEPELKRLMERQMPIKNKAVFNAEGRRIGHVDEYTFDPNTFVLVEYLVMPDGLAGFMGVAHRIPTEWVLSCGPDALVVQTAGVEGTEHRPESATAKGN